MSKKFNKNKKNKVDLVFDEDKRRFVSFYMFGNVRNLSIL